MKSLVERRLRRERAQQGGNPNVQLRELVTQFNDGRYAHPLTSIQRCELKRLLVAVDQPRGRLSPEEDVIALRLIGCIAAKLDSMANANDIFANSARRAREQGLDHAELITLIDWRRYFYASLGDEWPLPPYYPDEQIQQRIEELADRTGYLPMRHREELDFELWPELAEAEVGGDVMKVIKRATKIRRYCVDVGDVGGEARSSLLLAHAFSWKLEWKDRMAVELLRRSGLERLWAQPVTDYPMLYPFGTWEQWVTENERERLRSEVQRSIWGKAVAAIALNERKNRTWWHRMQEPVQTQLKKLVRSLKQRGRQNNRTSAC